MGPERDRLAADLTHPSLRSALALLTLLPALLAAGCGEDEDPSGSADLPAAGGGGTLTYAVDRLPATLDPLAARSRSAQLVTRQIHEPLVASMTGPYGDDGDDQSRPGLALSVRPSPNRTVWRVALRPGVRFQDGTPFNAGVVLDNARRWSSAPGAALLPGLFAVDAPRPDEVRFLFERPASGLRERLASPRLGIVSSRGLGASDRSGVRFLRNATGTGTGPFELGSRSRRQLELGRDPAWWGGAIGLGPAVDRVTFVGAAAESERLELLQGGEAKVAEPFGRESRAAIGANPLLRARIEGGTGVGFEASVRGLEPSSGGVPLLSRVWLTTIGG